MSDQAMAWARSIKTGSVGRKAVLYVLANHAVKDGVVHDCSQKAIAEEAELSERQVRTILADLERIGVIARDRRAGSGRGRQHDIIRLRMAELPLILGAQRNRQPEVSSADEATGKIRRLRTQEKTSGCRSPKGLLAVSPEMTSGEQGQPATGNRKSFPVAMEVVILEGSNNTKQNTSPPIVPPFVSAGDGSRAVEIYNAAAAKAGWVVAKGPHSEARKRAVKARLREFGGIEGWTAQVALAASMPFLGGDSERGWRMNLDWFCKPASWTKIAEGSYRQVGSASEPERPDDGLGVFRAACTYRERSGEWPKGYGPEKIPDVVRAQYPDLFKIERVA